MVYEGRPIPLWSSVSHGQVVVHCMEKQTECLDVCLLSNGKEKEGVWTWMGEEDLGGVGKGFET